MPGSCHSLRRLFFLALRIFKPHSFFQPDLPDVLHNLNFSVRPGEKACSHTISVFATLMFWG